MSNESLLTDLCKICNTNLPKYTCPRCAARTCSLACSKRHKTLASCSGKRDTAAYLKRSDLATPAAIDHDYNFISGVERAVERREHDLESRGIALDGKGRGLGGKMELALRERGVHIVRAPKGLSRERQNRSVWNGVKNCVVWSVEWVLPDGSRKVQTASEEMEVGAAYEAAFAVRPHGKKRKHNHDGHVGEPEGINPTTRRTAKRGTDEQAGTLTTNEDDDEESSKRITESQAAGAIQSPDKLGTESEAHPSSLEPMKEDFENEGAGAEQSTDSLGMPREATKSQSTGVAGPQNIDQIQGTARQGGPSQNRRFYLHIPDTPSSSRVVAHIPQGTTLKAALMNRTVLEFPTVYVFDEGKGLPDGLVEEAEWRRTRSGIVEVVEVGQEEDGDGDEAQAVGVDGVKSEDVLASLSRNVGVVGGVV